MVKKWWLLVVAIVVALVIIGVVRYVTSPVITAFFPKHALAGEHLYILGENLERLTGPSQSPRVYVAGVQAQILSFLDNGFVVLVPNMEGEGTVRLEGTAGEVESRERIRVHSPTTLSYPRDRPLFWSSAHSRLFTISPFGLDQEYVIIVGAPTDVPYGFTFNELEADVLNRFGVVNAYWSTISKQNVSLKATVYPQIVPLQKTYGEYIHESRYPVAKGQVIEEPINLQPYSDRNVSIEVADPDGNTYTLTATLPQSNLALPGQIFGHLLSGHILAAIVAVDADHFAIEVMPLGAGEQDFRGNGYTIIGLEGEAWGALGLASPTLIPGSGDPAAQTGGDTAVSPSWWWEAHQFVVDSGFSTDDYDGRIYMLIGTPTLDEPADWWQNPVPYGYSESHSFRASAAMSAGLMRLPHDEPWMVWTHETGHNLSLRDQYREGRDQPGQFVGGWSLMAGHDPGSHVTVWEKTAALGPYPGTGWLPAASILSPTPPGPGGAVVTSQFVLAPQYDPLPTSLPGNTHPIGWGVKIPLSTSHSLFVEARRDQPETTPRRFDENLDWLDAGEGHGGVAVYDVRDTRGAGAGPNVWRRELILLSPGDDALDGGESYDDPTIGVKIDVTGEIEQGSNRYYQVAVNWGRAMPPGGERYDAYLTPWDSWYQSPDIWVDSPVNGWDVYESQVQTPDGDPDGAGDTIAILEENRLKARIRNSGPEAIPSATVTFWVATPAGIGDRGDWQRLPPATTGSIPAGGSTVAETIWIPSGGGHTCVKVEVNPIDGEITFTNNMAQENFTNFEMVSGSPYEELDFSFLLFNPFDKKMQFALRPNRRSPWVGLEMDHTYPWLEAEGKLLVNGKVTLNAELQAGPKYDKNLSIAAHYPRHDSEVELGGIALHLQPRKRTMLEVESKEEKDGIYVSGVVRGGTGPRKVTISIHHDEERTYVWAKTGKDGGFSAKLPIKHDGPVEVYVYVPSSGEYSSAKSPALKFR